MGYSPQGHKESDMTERLHFHFHICFINGASLDSINHCICSVMEIVFFKYLVILMCVLTFAFGNPCLLFCG